MNWLSEDTKRGKGKTQPLAEAKGEKAKKEVRMDIVGEKYGSRL